MPGVRIRPKDERNVPDSALVVLTDKALPIPGANPTVSPVCSLCRIQHYHQTFHLRVRAGSVLVSAALWENLQRFPDDAGFEYANDVPDPPVQGMQPGKEVQLLEKWVPPITIDRGNNGDNHT